MNTEVCPTKTSVKLLGKSFNTAVCLHVQTFVENNPSSSAKLFSLIRAA